MMIVDDLSSFLWMEQTETCIAKVAARKLLRWCSMIGISRVWVSDTAMHFKISVLQLVAEKLAVDCHFSVANTASTNGTVKRVMLESVYPFRAVASAVMIPLQDGCG